MQSLALKQLIKNTIKDELRSSVPIGISNRHIHICEKDFNKLFPGKSLRVKKWLGQPGEFASEETVTLVGPKGELKNVRILGPLRKETQIELSMTDARILGISPPVALSGHLEQAAVLTLRSEAGEIRTKGAIIAKRHIHMTTGEAKLMGLMQGDVVNVSVFTDGRTVVFGDVEVRVNDGYAFEMHIDTDEANAANVTADTLGKIL